MTTDNRRPLPEGTEIRCENGTSFIIDGGAVAKGGSSLVFRQIDI